MLNLALGCLIIFGLVVTSMVTARQDTGFALALGAAITVAMAVTSGVVLRRQSR